MKAFSGIPFNKPTHFHQRQVQTERARFALAKNKENDMFTILQIMTGAGILISGILSSLAAIGGGAASLYSRKKSEERQNRYNREAEERQQGYIDDMNEYNSPKEQMNRMREAGLNPYLVDDPGNQGTANSAVTDTALDRADVIQNTANQVGSTVLDTGKSFEKALLEEKKYQLDVAKLDAQKAQFDEQMAHNRSVFNYSQSRDQINDAYRAARDQVNDKYNQELLTLKQKGFDFEKEKEETRKIESKRDYELKLAADGRAQQIHSLEVEKRETENKYNNDEYEFYKNHELPNKKIQAKLDNLVLKLNEAEKDVFLGRYRESMELEDELRKNRLTKAQYNNKLIELWDAHNHGNRYKSYGSGGKGYWMSNPLESSSEYEEITKLVLAGLKK